MKDRIIDIVRGITPPMALDLLRRLLVRPSFSGNYASWEEAANASTGYDTDEIINRVRDSLLDVKQGKAAFERDSILFDKPHYWWPLLTGLLWSASRNGNRLNLLDYGGALGTVYFQNRRFLEHLDWLSWSVVEQGRFVECGKTHFEDQHLRFYSDMEECIRERKPEVILFSGVLQYLERPYELLAKVVKTGFRQIIVDRTPFLKEGSDRITVQEVLPPHYRASYPSWFFNEGQFRAFFAEEYELMAEFDAFDTFRADDITAEGKGFLFSRKA